MLKNCNLGSSYNLESTNVSIEQHQAESPTKLGHFIYISFLSPFVLIGYMPRLMNYNKCKGD